ncbi:MAG TPA: hypothetical protein EYP17_09830 [Candidatus Latescibacteria bacterium]|nr:hypothetical protein [Candidatus Latescibacterota bacterium]
MATLDIIGSFVLGGLLLLTILNLEATLVDTSYRNTMQLIAQESLAGLVELVQYDFRKMGYGVPDPTASIRTIRLNEIVFLADVDEDGDVDTVRYAVSDTSLARMTPNPNDRLLYRQINGRPPEGDAWGVTDLSFRYFDANGGETSTPSLVRAIQVSLTVESPYAIGDEYIAVSWKGLLRPKNLPH